MSWLTDIAGRAETLLNKLDLEAASALTTKDRKQKSVSSSRDDQEGQYLQHSRHISSAPRTPQHQPDRTSKVQMASSASVPGDLNKYFRSSSSGLVASSSKPLARNIETPAAAATPAHSAYEPTDSTDILVDSSYSAVLQGQVAGSDSSSGESPVREQSSTSHSRQSSVCSSVASYPPLMASVADTDSPATAASSSSYTALSLESSSNSSTASTGSSGQLASYVTVDPQELPSSHYPPHSAAAVQGGISESSEVAMLRKEVVSLSQEMRQLVERSSTAQQELRVLRAAQSSGSGQLAGTQKLLTELQMREVDLQECLHAKDSQLAVLRVRLQEVDAELLSRSTALQQCQIENTRLCEGASVSSSRHSDALDSAQTLLSEAESVLKLEQQQHRATQDSYCSRLRELEGEREALLLQAKEASNRVMADAARDRGHHQQVSSLRGEVTLVRAELESYKTKAQHILRSKEQLIDSLKSGRTAGGAEDGADLLMSELTQAREELELTRDELRQSYEEAKRVRAELTELQSVAEQEAESHSAALREAEEQLTEQKDLMAQWEHETRTAKQEVRCLQEELSRHKLLLQTKLQDSDHQITALKTQLSQRRASGSEAAEQELQRKVRGLTEALLHKQGAIENLNTELQARTMQLSRIQQQYQDSQQLLSRDSSLLLHSPDDVRNRVPSLLVESPFDGGVTRRVKRAYTSLDRLSVGLGLLLRRYPIARILVLLYMLLLHLWVLVVLLTYSPEMHSADYNMGPPLPPERGD